MATVFVLQHLHRLPGGEDDVKMIGVYSTRKAAVAAVSRLSQAPGFKEHANIVDYDTTDDDEGFHIDEYEIDKDHWAEGYVTV
jgi:hypothetical protein